MIHTDKILFIPSLRKGNGTGHLKRCLDWAEKFKTIHILILKNGNEELIDFRSHPLCSHRNNIHWHVEVEGEWDVLILDNRSTSLLPDTLRGIPVIAIDEEGEIRKSVSYALDTLPGLNQQLMNDYGYRFIKRPYHSEAPLALRRVLVSFGGEDPKGLGLKFLKALQTDMMSLFLKRYVINVDLIIPSAEQKSLRNINSAVKVIDYVENLSEKLVDYDLIITQHGLTAFEALSVKRYIFLFNPAAYHDRLSASTGFPYKSKAVSLTSRELSELLPKILGTDPGTVRTRNGIHSKLWSIFAEKSEEMKPWITGMNISREGCPVCGSHIRTVLARYEQKSYFRCKDCGMKYMLQFRVKEDIYNKDYFFTDYKKQYGKTYIEDFPHIQELARKRLQRIQKLSSEKGELLDIGCAYGPFLLSAAEQGYTSTGLEISKEAVEYIAEHFKGIKAIQGDLNTKKTRCHFKEKQFEVLTLWYVIEHFNDLTDILPYLGSILKKGGVLAMATPFSSGVSGRFNPDHFYRMSPDDHYTLWDKKSAVTCLKRAGFSKIRFISTGHHPERFSPLIKTLIPRKVLMIASRILGWGDTFEIYAQKG